MPGRLARRSFASSRWPRGRSRAATRLRHAKARLPLAGCHAFDAVAKRAFDEADGRDHCPEILRLQRRGLIGPRQAAVQGQMLLDHRGPARGRRHRDLDAQGVVRVADGELEGVPQGIHRAQVDLIGGRRILRDAMQERQRDAAPGKDPADRPPHLRQRISPSKGSAACPFRDDVAQQALFVSSRRKLEAIDAQTVEHIRALLIERRRQEEDAGLGATRTAVDDRRR